MFTEWKLSWTVLVLTLCSLAAGAVELPDRIMSFDYTHNFSVKPPVLPREANRLGSVKSLLERCSGVLDISEAELVKLMPEKGGMMFARCPKVKCGNRGEKFSWNIAKPQVLHCLICKSDLTVQDYPEDNVVEAVTPEGRKVQYRYHRRADGRHCWITGGMDYLKYRYFCEKAWQLGSLYLKTNDKTYARKAAVIIAHLSKAYLNTPYKIEPWLRSPYKEIHIYNGVPDDKENWDAQRARPTSWAYMDIPDKLLLAYDFIGNSGELERYAAEINMDVKKDIVRGYFMNTVESTSLKREFYGNMSPYYWAGMMIAGRVLGIPEYVHLAVLRVREFIKQGFFYDGAWREVTSGYHQQCVVSLTVFERIVNGYSDPEGFRCKYDNSNYQNFELFANDPIWKGANELVSKYLLYPDNIAVPHNDTLFNLKWRWGKPGKVTPSNFVSSWRHLALKSRVFPQQIQLRIAGGPGSIHRQQDMFNITLWALGAELLGDIGYTHSRYRQYASSLPHHNTVTVDFKLHKWWGGYQGATEKVNQMASGALPVYADISNTAFQVGQFKSDTLYKHVKNQQRTVMLVELDEKNSYAVDFFDLAPGGKTYDYFLHGNCNEDNIAPAEAGFAPAAIFPERLRLPEPKGEIDRNSRKDGYGYQGLFDTQKHKNPSEVFVGHWQYKNVESALTVYLAAAGGKRSIWMGNSPSIRRAAEDSAKVDKFFRRFYLQRIEKPVGQVRFAAVMEPHKPGCALIKKVTVPVPGLVKVELADRTDYIFCDLKKTVPADGWKFAGKIGFLSVDKKNKVQKYYLFDGSINGSGFSASAPGMLDLEIVDCIGFDTFKVRDLSLLPEKYNPAVVLELPGEKSAWQFNIKSVDRAKNLVKLDRPHGLQRKNDQWVRTHYQQQNFDGKAYIKIGLPNFTNK